jgi:hypothetical protein
VGTVIGVGALKEIGEQLDGDARVEDGDAAWVADCGECRPDVLCCDVPGSVGGHVE